jgi:hypothetical protein
MATAEKSQVSEVIAPDFQRMKRIFLHDLRGLEERSAKVRGDQSNAWKTIEKDAHCNKSGGMGADNLVTLADRRPDPDAAAFENDAAQTQPAA